MGIASDRYLERAEKAEQEMLEARARYDSVVEYAAAKRMRLLLDAAVRSENDAMADYLAQPCDEPGCSDTATHNQAGKKFCNKHTDRDAPAFARDD